MIILYYGDGKGKTTAALGLALRAAGSGKKVMILQFIKAQLSNEHKSINQLENIEIKARGKGFYKIGEDKQPEATHRRAAYQTLREAQKIIQDSIYEVIVLDEIIDTLQWKLLNEKAIIDLIKSKAKEKILILTGHIAPENILELCDLVTEMKKIKHPYDKGIRAIEGIDF